MTIELAERPQQAEQPEDAFVITRASAYDAGRIARMLDEWFAEASLDWPQPRADCMVSWVLATIMNGYVVIAERRNGGRLYGVAGLMADHLPWNDEEPVMRDAFFFVRRAHRKMGIADALLTALKTYCAKHDVPLIMNIVSGKATDKLERWYEIRGGEYIGGTLAFGLPVKEK